MRAVFGFLGAALLLGAGCDDTIFGVPAEGSGGTLVYEPTWDGLVAMSDDHCAACHHPGGSAGDVSIPDLVQADLQLGERRLVVPDDPEGSMLWRILGGTLAGGDPGDMPLGQRLDVAQVDHIRLWILDGAPFPALEIDADGDGFGPDEGDCADDDPTIHPGVAEVCDGIDNNCDGSVDGADAEGAQAWYPDSDGDGFGDQDQETVQCNPPAGWGPTGGDCDDASAAVYPNAPEPDCTDPVDYNCDGVAGAVDGDGDGFFACEECNDADVSMFPGADEVCDGVDQDCDGVVDEEAIDPSDWYPDADGDGYGDGSVAPVPACAAPPGHVADNTDCDDSRATVSPGADEVCSGLDNDCNGTPDDNPVDPTAYYPDADGDGYGDGGASPILACSAPPDTVAQTGDCDDTDPAFNPGAVEDDCADPTDYNCDGVTGAVDNDGDGFFACDECNDSDPLISPNAAEVCDGVDNDCSGAVDDTPIDGQLWFPDADLDGHGDDSDPGTLACSAPAQGWTTLADDCDDGSALIAPGTPEVCDGVDQDCDGTADDNAVDAITWYEDSDGDGQGAGPAILDCDPVLAGHATVPGDCNDSDATVNSAADEVCDGTDNDCSGAADDNAVDAATWHIDADLDGWGAESDPGTLSCTPVAGAVDRAGDCDDGDPAVSPDADEVCDGVDNDCSLLIDDDAVDADLWFVDVDGDGFGDELDPGLLACTQPLGTVLDGTDCDDADPSVNPAITLDLQDGADNDCDGQIDEDGAAVSHAVDIQPIWDQNCTGTCHAAPAPSGGLNLDVNAYANLVNTPSDDVPSMDRVEPGDPANSYLWHKLNGTQNTVGGMGNQMPAAAGGPPGGGTALPAQDLALIEQWILAGAPP